MGTRQIPKESWLSFLDNFTRDHELSPVTVEIIGSEAGGDQEQVHDMPLLGISADLKDGEDIVTMIFGHDKDNRLTHMVRGTRHIWVREAAGEQEALEIESADGVKTLMTVAKVRVP
jgi:hypothetical protein